MKSKTQYYLLGMLVSKKIYYSFSERTYPFMGRSVHLDALYMFATDKTIKELLPEYHTEASEIIHDIKMEMTRLERTKSSKCIEIPLELAERLYEESALANRIASGLKDAKECNKSCFVFDPFNFSQHPVSDKTFNLPVNTETAQQGFVELEEFMFGG